MTKAALLAIAAATIILSSTSALADDPLERALSLAAAERYREARHVVDRVLAREPGSPRARLLHGILRVREERSSEAVGIFEELAKDRPQMFEAHNNLAVLYAEEGRLDEARATLFAALQRRPDALGYRNLGDIYAQLAHRAYSRGGTVEPGGEAQLEGSDDAGGTSKGAETAADSAGVEKSGDACMAAGEFGDPSSLQDARRWLRSHGAEIVGERSEERDVIENYRVYLPPFPSREAAAAKIREIRKRGIRDVALISRGPLANSVSLGVYKNKAYMDLRVLHLKELGYPALWKASGRKESSTILEARVAGAMDALGTAWASQFPGHTLRNVDCRRSGRER